MSGHSHGHGDHDHSGCCDHDHNTEDDAQGDSLFGSIDTVNVKCLNESEDGAGQRVFKALADKDDRALFVESDDGDPELIFHVPFTSMCNIKSICVAGAADGASPDKVRIFKDRDDIDFSNVEDMKEVQALEIHEDLSAEIWYTLRAAKFRNVASLDLHIPSNYGADATKIYYIGLKGECTKSKRQIVECVYESAAQMQDHKVPDEEFGSSNLGL